MQLKSKNGITIINIILCCLSLILILSAAACKGGNGTKEIAIEVHEGTELAFDLSPDGQTIVFDLLGQIWLLPVEGGEAQALTNSVKENAEHLFPTFTAEGKRIVFWESRPESWGLTSMNLMGEERSILTESDSDTDIFHACSPDNSFIAFVRDRKLMLLRGDESKTIVELKIDGLPNPGIKYPVWAPDGSHIAFVNAVENHFSHRAGRLWQVEAKGGAVKPITPENSVVRAPAYSPDGQKIAYFMRSKNSGVELRIQELDNGETQKLVKDNYFTPVRIRWSPQGDFLYYCAKGRFWRISVEGGIPQEIPFTARLSFAQKQANLNPPKFPDAGQIQSARGHMGFVLSPDGKKIAAIALEKLWIWNVGEKPKIVTNLPSTSTGLSWSPDGTEVAWSAGYEGIEDLFATNVQSGTTRRLTSIPGTELKATWSSDGKYIAFMHLEDSRHEIKRRRRNVTLRALELDKAPVAELSETLELKTYRGPGLTNILSVGLRISGSLWGPDSQWLLGGSGRKPTLIFLDGREKILADSKTLPVSPHAFVWETERSLLYLKNYELWRIPFDPEKGLSEEAALVSEDPALYPSTARDGSILYASGDGWRLRRPNGEVEHIGWPISYEIPESPESIVISNVKLIDGTGQGMIPSRDILIEEGCIVKIASHGGIKGSQETKVIKGEGRVVIPGLIDAHVHIWHQILLPEYLYEGITTVRDMGSKLPLIKGFQESIEAGIKAGPRVVLGGLQLGPSLVPSVKGWNPDGMDGFIRVLSLAKAFDLDFIKMYWPINPYSGAKFIELAHESGFPISSHFGYPLPLVAAGIDSKEHLNDLMGSTGPRFGGVLYDDIIQLSKAGGVSIVPTIDMAYRFTAAHTEESAIEEANSSPFLYDKTINNVPALRSDAALGRSRGARVASENVTRFHEAGVPLAAGTDYPFYWIPWMLHREIEQYVRAGMSPLEAIVSATRNAARALHAEKDIGTIEEGKLADLIILDANPLEDIRNTRKIWKVIKGGKIVDREALKNWLKHEAEEVENIGK